MNLEIIGKTKPLIPRSENGYAKFAISIQDEEVISWLEKTSLQHGVSPPILIRSLVIHCHRLAKEEPKT